MTRFLHPAFASPPPRRSLPSESRFRCPSQLPVFKGRTSCTKRIRMMSTSCNSPRLSGPIMTSVKMSVTVHRLPLVPRPWPSGRFLGNDPLSPRDLPVGPAEKCRGDHHGSDPMNPAPARKRSEKNEGTKRKSSCPPPEGRREGTDGFVEQAHSAGIHPQGAAPAGSERKLRRDPAPHRTRITNETSTEGKSKRQSQRLADSWSWSP